MPELPEVETVKNTLLPKLKGRRITGVEIYLPRLVKYPSPEEFAALVQDRKILDITRRGKYLLFYVAGNYRLVFHLRMTGRLLYLPADAPVVKHTHIIFQLDNRDQLRFQDLRTFGAIYLIRPEEVDRIRGMASLGPEPLEDEFTPDYLRKALAGRRTTIKNALLSQKIIAGLGNIYASESLFRAGIHPAREAASLTGEEILRLHRAIRAVLTEGIRYRGTSVRNYVDAEGRAGEFQERLAVYGRAGKPCVRCGTPLEQTRIGGRSSVYCPSCQPIDVGHRLMPFARKTASDVLEENCALASWRPAQGLVPGRDGDLKEGN